MDPALYFLEKSSSSRANGWFSEFIAPELDDANQRPGWWSRWWCCWSWLAGYWRWTGWEDHLVDLSSARPQPPASSVSGKPLYLPLTYLHSKRWWCGTNHKETTKDAQPPMNNKTRTINHRKTRNINHIPPASSLSGKPLYLHNILTLKEMMWCATLQIPHLKCENYLNSRSIKSRNKNKPVPASKNQAN